MSKESSLIKGETVLFSTGSYSDYYISGVFRARVGFDLANYQEYGFPTQEELDEGIKEVFEQRKDFLEHLRRSLTEKDDKYSGRIKARIEEQERWIDEPLTDPQLETMKRWSGDRFMANLLKMNLIEEVDHREFNLEDGVCPGLDMTPRIRK